MCLSTVQEHFRTAFMLLVSTLGHCFALQNTSFHLQMCVCGCVIIHLPPKDVLFFFLIQVYFKQSAPLKLPTTTQASSMSGSELSRDATRFCIRNEISLLVKGKNDKIDQNYTL